MEILFSGDFAASATETTAGSLILISRVIKERIELLQQLSIELKGRPQSFLRLQLSDANKLQPLDVLEVRRNLSSDWGALMTQHLMLVHKQLNRDDTDIVAYTAWRYTTLTYWGEASAAREISLDLNSSIHTIHYRLKLARERGILKSPGAGARLGR